MENNYTIGRRLKEERERLRLTQEAFGGIASMTRKTVANYEADERKPDAEFLSLIAKEGADILYIVTGVRSESINSDRHRAADLPASGQQVEYEPHAMEIAIGYADAYIGDATGCVLPPKKKAKLIRILYEDIMEDEFNEVDSKKVIDLIELASEE